MRKEYSYVKKAFSRIAIGISLCVLTSNLAGIFLSYFAINYFNVGKELQNVIYELVPIYIIGMPIGWLVVSGLPTHLPQKNKIGFANFISFICISILAMYIGSAISTYLSAWIASLIGFVPRDVLDESINNGNIYINLFTMVFIAPITEELFYRKMIIDRTSMFGERPAIIFSALAFALMHGNVYQMIYAFIVGLIFGYVYCKSGKIGIVIFVHIFINLLCGAVPTLIEELFVSELVQSAYMMIYNMFLIVIYILGLIFFIIQVRSIELEDGIIILPGNKWGKYVFGNIGTIMMILVAILLFVSMTFL